MTHRAPFRARVSGLVCPKATYNYYRVHYGGVEPREKKEDSTCTLHSIQVGRTGENVSGLIFVPCLHQDSVTMDVVLQRTAPCSCVAPACVGPFSTQRAGPPQVASCRWMQHVLRH